jgi:hypothetical protein
MATESDAIGYNLFRSQRRVILSGVVNLRMFKNLSTSNYKPRKSGRRHVATQSFSRTKRSKLDGMRMRPRLLFKELIVNS